MQATYIPNFDNKNFNLSSIMDWMAKDGVLRAHIEAGSIEDVLDIVELLCSDHRRLGVQLDDAP